VGEATEWTARLGRLVVLAWGGAVAFLLLGPTVMGLAIDRAAHSSPWGLVMGSLLGVIMATILVTAVVLAQFRYLAPANPKEDEPS
jgi:F0F1-type ATP synthase assembly protein I